MCDNSGSYVQAKWKSLIPEHQGTQQEAQERPEPWMDGNMVECLLQVQRYGPDAWRKDLTNLSQSGHLEARTYYEGVEGENVEDNSSFDGSVLWHREERALKIQRICSFYST